MRMRCALSSSPPRPGVRLAGHWDGFESAVRVILGQQVTVAAARTLTQRLVQRFGTPVQTPFPGLDRLFPDAATLATADPADIGTLGFRGEALAAITTMLQVSIGTGIVVLLVAGVALAALLARRLRRLTQVRDAMRDIGSGEGDLARRIDAQGEDELAQIATDFNSFASKLSGVLLQIRDASGSVRVASEEIASGNQDLSSRTELTASNLQQTTASMEQLTETVRHNADAARQANQLVAQASSVAQHGGKVVGDVVATMEQINTASRKISDIIGVIDGIAFQTNILALNAAVEAARAGEQGRGFAVVASEVRSLASRSAEAAKEIKGLISASVQEVANGSRLVNDAGTTMTDIVTSVQRVTDIMAEISASTSEQSTSIAEVGQAVSQLDQMTQQNAALVEQSAAAAESLKGQAARLAELVSVFRLTRDANYVH
mgnify:CR=1 FL=1